MLIPAAGAASVLEFSRSVPGVVTIAATAVVCAAFQWRRFWGMFRTNGSPRAPVQSVPRHSGDAPATIPTAAPAAPAAATALPPVVILGGEANALSVARDLAAMGVRVYAIGDPASAVRHSRQCRWIPVDLRGRGAEEAWAGYLLGPESDHLKGAVVLACSDAGIQVLARHRPALLERYKLDDSNPPAQIAVLDKLTTYEHALAAGVPTPRFWRVESREQVVALREALVFPLLVKPRLSHLFENRFGKKFLLALGFDELLAAFDVASGAGMETLLMEWIPGGDERLCSYFTYLDEHGTPLFHFTKRVIRRYPVGMGSASYHITDWIPALVEPSTKLLAHVGLRGLANIEYKYDARDGRYKLIECNARFTASNRLVSASGFNLAAFVYNRLTGRPQAALKEYRSGMRLWDPVRDWLSFRELRRAGGITFGQWVRSVMHRQTFAFFAWSDPMPTLVRATKPLRRLLRSGS